MALSLVNQSAALVGRVDNILIEFHLSKTNGSCRARTWTTRLADKPLMLFPRPKNDVAVNKKCFLLVLNKVKYTQAYCVWKYKQD